MFKEYAEFLTRPEFGLDKPSAIAVSKEAAADQLFSLHPSAIADLIEYAWSLREAYTTNAQDSDINTGNTSTWVPYQIQKNRPLGHPIHRSDLLSLDPEYLSLPVIPQPLYDIPGLRRGISRGIHLTATTDENGNYVSGEKPTADFKNEENIFNRVSFQHRQDPDHTNFKPWCFRWHHLIYAYMIENTCIYEVFDRVLRELLYGEKLGAPIAECQGWLRNTEELFYKDPSPFAIHATASHLRPNFRATRRNAYWRMFGFSLSHGREGDPHYPPVPYVTSDATNSEFTSTFEELLREVWVGMINNTNISGAKPTDKAKIANLAEKLCDMLMTRRQYGNLSREEFAAVTMMSWFHLSLDYNSPIVRSLRAEASSKEQRLFNIAQRVGLPVQKETKSYFELAEPLSRILTLIETGLLNDPEATPALYTPAEEYPTDLQPVNSPSLGSPEADMTTIITHWSIITGRDMKARRVSAN